MSESPESIAAASSAASAFSRSASASASESPPDAGPHYHDSHNSGLSLDNHNDHAHSHGRPSTSTLAPPPAEKPFHSKRPHKKSRAGCKNCKARKVKCDEVRPTCKACRLRKADCVYPEPTANAAAPSSSSSSTSLRTSHKAAVRHASSGINTPASGSSSSQSGATTLPLHPSPFQSPASRASNLFADPVLTSFDPDDDLNLGLPDDPLAGIDMGDPTYDATTPLLVVSEPLFRPLPTIDDTEMKLMWWYTAHTATSFSINADKAVVTPSVEIMRGQLVQHAFGSPFLMDSLYALTALHLCQLDPSGATVDPKRAVYYRQKSFVGYRKAIEEADPATFPALLSNSLLLCALSSQNFREADAPDLYMIDWMVVWKGIGLIVNLISVPALVASGLAALFYRPRAKFEDAGTAIPNHLLFMISSIPSHDPDYPDREVYYDTLKHLGTLFQNLRQGGVNPIMGLRIVTAFTFVPARFVELARLRRPRTLVILAYYAMFFKLIPVVWWTKGIGQRTLRDICNHLGSDWHHLLRAPMMAIHVDDITAVARLILEDPTWEGPEDETGAEWEREVRDLTWVDNKGRRIVLQPEQDRMVAKEEPDGPDLIPYYDPKNKDDIQYKYQMGYGLATTTQGDSPETLAELANEINEDYVPESLYSNPGY